MNSSQYFDISICIVHHYYLVPLLGAMFSVFGTVGFQFSQHLGSIIDIYVINLENEIGDCIL